jgi:hypothetical protein
LPGGTDKNHTKPLSVQFVSGPRFEPGTSQSINVKIKTDLHKNIMLPVDGGGVLGFDAV